MVLSYSTFGNIFQFRLPIRAVVPRGIMIAAMRIPARAITFALSLFITIPSLLAADATQTDTVPPKVLQNLVLAPSPANPRNSEGDFINLKDGRILFVYTHFTGGVHDAPASYLASRVSSDGGKSWSDRDETVIDAKVHGVPIIASVSLLRLKDDRIALFYLVKKTDVDSQMVMRTSSDETRTWSEATACTSGPGYFLVTNSRVVQLKSRRIIFPAARHEVPQSPEGLDRGVVTCFSSDDNGTSWHASKGNVEAMANSHSGLKDPVIVELKDGRLMMLMCIHLHPLFQSFSADAGDTWSTPQATDLATPVSTASIKRIPSTGDLMLVWNDHAHSDPALKNKRTPLTAAISKDEGKTWESRKTLYSDSDGTYCYAAIDFVGDRVLLGHCAGQHRGAAGLARTVITSFNVNWLYASK